MATKKVSKTVKSETPIALKPKLGDDNAFWVEFREKELMAFGLSGQKVKDHVKFIAPSGKDNVIVSLKSSAMLPLLEETFSKSYSFTLAENYVIVTKL